MNGLFTLLIVGWLAYMLLGRKGGMGGCGGGHHDHRQSADKFQESLDGDGSVAPGAKGAVIDLTPDDYQVLSDNDPHDARHRVIGRDAPQAQ